MTKEEDTSVPVPFARAIEGMEGGHCDDPISCAVPYFGCNCDCDKCLAVYGLTQETNKELNRQQSEALDRFIKKNHASFKKKFNL